MKAFTELGTIAKILWKWICVLIKVAWTLAALIIVGLTATFVVLIFVDTEISHTVSNRYYVYKHNMIDRYYIYDSRSGKKTIKWISTIDKSFGEDSLIRFSRKNFWGNNERFGYIDARTAKVAIEPQYHFAGKFSEGLAAVSQSGEVGFIDTTGKLVVPVKEGAHYIASVKMCDGCAILDTGGEYGYGIISRDGEWILMPEYDNIIDCSEGRFIVRTEDYDYGVWSQSEGWILEPKYDEIEEPYLDGGFVVTENGMRWKCDYNGKTTIALTFDSAEILSHTVEGRPAEERIASGYAIFHVDQMAGLLEVSTGKVLIPAIYDDIEMLSNSVFMVTVGNYKHLVDRNGKVINGK